MRDGIGIRIRGVSKKLGATQALKDVDGEFEAGMLHGVIGPEGAGKTTLLRTLVGLLHANHGDIEYRSGGRPVPFSEVRPFMAYMPQSQSLYPDLSVSEHLQFFQDLYGIPEDVYRERRSMLLGITRLEQFQERRAGQLSGGMYKKLGLMCALLQSPKVVLLDEPTNGVDPISRREFWELLYGLRKEGILIIVTTAYMDEAERCGRVHVLDQGRVIAEGEPRELLEREGTPNFDALFLKRARGGGWS